MVARWAFHIQIGNKTRDKSLRFISRFAMRGLWAGGAAHLTTLLWDGGIVRVCDISKYSVK